MLTSFGRFNLIFNQMALIFLGVLIVLPFQVSSQLALTSSLMMSGPIHPTSIHWIIKFGGNAGVLAKSCNRSQNQFPSFKMHFS